MSNDPKSVPARVPPAGDVELPVGERFTAYRHLLASPRDELVHWWYFGTVQVELAGLPPFPAINAATLMVYRTETLSRDRYAIHWDEVGCFTDYVTGKPQDGWLNPVTGQNMAAPRSFAEGPARYEIERTADGVAISLDQPGATISSIDVSWRCEGQRLWLVQRERKKRGFPEVDGKLPDPGSASGFEAETLLAFVDEWPSDGRNANGLYRFGLAGAPPWMGLDSQLKARATVYGVIVKATPAAPPRPEALAALRAFYPQFFARHRI
jgi:hypothetical protein